jgi:hypothetical protein
MLLPAIPQSAAAPRAPRRNLVRSMLLGGAIGASLAMLGFWIGSRFASLYVLASLRELPRNGWALSSAALIAWFLSTLIHELGHIAAGVTQGFRFQLLVVGPFAVQRDGLTDRIRLGWNRQFELAGGVAATLPDSDERLSSRMRWMVIAGPVASVLLTVLAAWWWWHAPSGWGGAVRFFTAVIAAGTGIATLIPMDNGSFVTDGKRFLQLGRDDERARRDTARLVLFVREQSGLRLRDEPGTRIASLLEPADASLGEVGSRLVAAAWLVDHGAYDEAEQHLARAAAIADGLPFYMAAAVAIERARLVAQFARNGAAARALLAPHAKAMARAPKIIRQQLDAALALADGDAETARRLATEAMQLLQSSPNARTGNSQWALARLAEIEAASRETQDVAL